MGNSLILSKTGSDQLPCHLQLGKSVAIDLSKKEKPVPNSDGSSVAMMEFWTLLYTVDGSAFDFRFTRRVCQSGNIDQLCLILRDGKCLSYDFVRLVIEITETDFLRVAYMQYHCKSFGSITWTKTRRIVDACGGITDTRVYFYGSGNRCGLIVSVSEKKSAARLMTPDGDLEEADAVTVAHYFASSGTDTGLSLVAKIRPCNGNLVAITEGPESHPASALLYMFDEVIRTRIWKPNMIPDCAVIASIPREPRRMTPQSASEETDSVSVPVRHQNARKIDNRGRFRGNGCGCIIDNVYIFLGR